MAYYRYDKFIENGRMKLVPFAEIPNSSMDRFEVYQQGLSRLDNISYKHYKDPNYGWLILQANPEVGGLEFNIPSGTLLRIPYPLETSLSAYDNSLKLYDELYGIE